MSSKFREEKRIEWENDRDINGVIKIVLFVNLVEKTESCNGNVVFMAIWRATRLRGNAISLSYLEENQNFLSLRVLYDGTLSM